MTGGEDQLFVAILFGTTHDALAAEDALKSAGIDVVPVPTPPSSDSLCGIAMRVTSDQLDRARSALAESRIEVRGVLNVDEA